LIFGGLWRIHGGRPLNLTNNPPPANESPPRPFRAQRKLTATIKGPSLAPVRLMRRDVTIVVAMFGFLTLLF
jgi:hypothetical protein